MFEVVHDDTVCIRWMYQADRSSDVKMKAEVMLLWVHRVEQSTVCTESQNTTRSLGLSLKHVQSEDKRLTTLRNMAVKLLRKNLSVP